MMSAYSEEHLKISLDIFMDEYTRYLRVHGLKINNTKCEHIVLTLKKVETKITLDGEEETQFVKHNLSQYLYVTLSLDNKALGGT